MGLPEISHVLCKLLLFRERYFPSFLCRIRAFRGHVEDAFKEAAGEDADGNDA